MPYVTDTHSLVWYMTNNPALSVRAKRLFKMADDSADSVVIPCIVFFEIVYLIEKKKIDVQFDSLIHSLRASRNYKIEPLCLPIIDKSRAIPRTIVKDPWDRLIAATSIHLGLPLITQDRYLRKLGIKIVE